MAMCQRLRVNGKTYHAVVLFTLLCGAQTWTVYTLQMKKHYAFMIQHLRL